MNCIGIASIQLIALLQYNYKHDYSASLFLYTPHLDLIHQSESLVLLLWHDIEILLKDILSLTVSITPLDPGVVPIQVRHLAGHINLSVLHRKERAILSEAHIQTRMESCVPLCGQDSSR